MVAAIIAGCKPEIPKMTGLDENKVLKESLKCWENPQQTWTESRCWK